MVGARAEVSRRFVHAATGIAVALCPPFFTAPTGIYALAVLFAGVNVVAIRRRFFPGMHGTERETWGTVAFPLALIAALWLCWTLDPGRVYILQTAFLVLGVSDPLAAWVGERSRGRAYRVNGQTKTLAGSLAFAASAAGLVAFGVVVWGPEAFDWREVVMGALVAAGLAASAEALGTKGWDNLWIVLAVVVALAALGPHPMYVAPFLFIALIVAVVFAALSWRVGFLDLSGALAAGLLAWGVVGLGPMAAGGAGWAAVGFTFFFASSVLSRLGRRRKRDAEARAIKGNRRDAGQVLANGGVAAVYLAATAFASEPAQGALFVAFVGAFAAAAADTWGTEIGTWVGGPTWDVLRWRRVPPGESGGVSIAGTLGGMLGALLIGWVAVGLGTSLWAATLAVGAGVLGAWTDSLLGATVQARFLAPDGSLTERPTLGGQSLPLARGWRWVSNDMVNGACTAVGGAVPLVVLGLA